MLQNRDASSERQDWTRERAGGTPAREASMPIAAPAAAAS